MGVSDAICVSYPAEEPLLAHCQLISYPNETRVSIILPKLLMKFVSIAFPSQNINYCGD